MIPLKSFSIFLVFLFTTCYSSKAQIQWSDIKQKHFSKIENHFVYPDVFLDYKINSRGAYIQKYDNSLIPLTKIRINSYPTNKLFDSGISAVFPTKNNIFLLKILVTGAGQFIVGSPRIKESCWLLNKNGQMIQQPTVIFDQIPSAANFEDMQVIHSSDSSKILGIYSSKYKKYTSGGYYNLQFELLDAENLEHLESTNIKVDTTVIRCDTASYLGFELQDFVMGKDYAYSLAKAIVNTYNKNSGLAEQGIYALSTAMIDYEIDDSEISSDLPIRKHLFLIRYNLSSQKAESLPIIANAYTIDHIGIKVDTADRVFITSAFQDNFKRFSVAHSSSFAITYSSHYPNSFSLCAVDGRKFEIIQQAVLKYPENYFTQFSGFKNKSEHFSTSSEYNQNSMIMIHEEYNRGLNKYSDIALIHMSLETGAVTHQRISKFQNTSFDKGRFCSYGIFKSPGAYKIFYNDNPDNLSIASEGPVKTLKEIDNSALVMVNMDEKTGALRSKRVIENNRGKMFVAPQNSFRTLQSDIIFVKRKKHSKAYKYGKLRNNGF